MLRTHSAGVPRPVPHPHRRTRLLWLCVVLLTACTDMLLAPAAPVRQPATPPTPLVGVLRGEAVEGCAWLDTGAGAVQVRWPAGYRVTAPPVELRDPTGAVVAIAGERLAVHGRPDAGASPRCHTRRVWNAVDVQPVR